VAALHVGQSHVSVRASQEANGLLVDRDASLVRPPSGLLGASERAGEAVAHAAQAAGLASATRPRVRHLARERVGWYGRLAEPA
jgi:hypothetical protein